MTLQLKPVDFDALTQCNIKKIHVLFRAAFDGHFTSLLSERQLEHYLFKMSHGAEYAKCFLVLEGGDITGFAVVGEEVSLLSVFKKIDSFGNFRDSISLCARLLKRPRIIWGSIINIINREAEGIDREGLTGKLAYLGYVCVDSSSASKGLGSKLMGSIKQSLKREGISYLYCHMDATSSQVKNYYIKNGWTVMSLTSTRALAWLKVS